ncbi:MAG: thioredoxin family protein [Bernardetiaceae bacterium]|nr:thioredoxin family protein [Bernardetiaceae bacterium]
MAVEIVKDDTFQENINQNERVIVKYYADWCGNCRLFAPKFKRLSNDERFADVHFIDVNAEDNPEARKAANVSNLPFFAIFKNGEFVDGAATSKEEAVVELLENLKA